MPVFKVNNFEQVGVSLESKSKTVRIEKMPTVRMPRRLSVEALPEMSFEIEPIKIDLLKSATKWSLNLQSISLYENFEGLLANLFGLIRPNNEIYFTSIAWDYSGEKPFIYPPKGSKGEDCMLKMKEGTKKVFMGNGVNLFPARQVVGALNIVIIVYECDQDVQKLGEQFVKIHELIDNSKLTSIIKTISINPGFAVGVTVAEAVTQLLGVIGGLMKQNTDDFVDLFEGSFGTDREQIMKIEKHDTDACGIELEFRTSGL